MKHVAKIFGIAVQVKEVKPFTDIEGVIEKLMGPGLIPWTGKREVIRWKKRLALSNPTPSKKGSSVAAEPGTLRRQYGFSIERNAIVCRRMIRTHP